MSDSLPMLPSRADELYASSGRGDWGTNTMTGRGILAILLTALVVGSAQAQAPTETVTTTVPTTTTTPNTPMQPTTTTPPGG